MSELKQCPRCGAEAHVVTEDGEPTMFLCEDCGCWLDVSEFETTENAFKWWNDRPFIDALNARIAELSQAVGLITTLKPTMVMDANHPLDMVREVAEHVTARIAELEEAQRWIPVSERLPEFDQDMFAVVEGEFKVGHFYQGLDFIKNKYENIYFSAGGVGLLVATHWFPIPDGLEEREE